MKKKITANIKLKSYDELFNLTKEDLADSKESQVVEIPIEELYEFKNHPFKVLDDEEMDKLEASVRQSGIYEPIKVRIRPEGGYEIIAGHRRRRACERAGLKVIPATIENFTDDEATIAMVDMNLYREKILISEKAKAYAMKYQAEKHQGKEGGNWLDEESENVGESRKQLQRYIRIAKLCDQLLDLVDCKKIGFCQAVELSFLNEEEQGWVLFMITSENLEISLKQATSLKKLSKEQKLSKEVVREMLTCKKEYVRKFSMNEKKIAEYFDKRYTAKQIEEIIYQLLEQWKQGEE